MELRESTYFILAALLDGPRHGYAIVKEVEQLSGGRVRLSAGTLYGALTGWPRTVWWRSSARRSSTAARAATTG